MHEASIVDEETLDNSFFLNSDAARSMQSAEYERVELIVRVSH